MTAAATERTENAPNETPPASRRTRRQGREVADGAVVRDRRVVRAEHELTDARIAADHRPVHRNRAPADARAAPDMERGIEHGREPHLRDRTLQALGDQVAAPVVADRDGGPGERQGREELRRVGVVADDWISEERRADGTLRVDQSGDRVLARSFDDVDDDLGETGGADHDDALHAESPYGRPARPERAAS